MIIEEAGNSSWLRLVKTLTLLTSMVAAVAETAGNITNFPFLIIIQYIKHAHKCLERGYHVCALGIMEIISSLHTIHFLFMDFAHSSMIPSLKKYFLCITPFVAFVHERRFSLVNLERSGHDIREDCLYYVYEI